MSEEVQEKRQGGQVAQNGEWLVITESTGEEGVGFTHSCGETIISVTRAHPIWDGPFRASGSGRCHYEGVPYCPRCEEEPSESGTPVMPKGSYHNPY